MRHGLLSRIVAMQNESRRGFGQLFGGHFKALEPTNGVELALTWRLHRLRAIDNKMLNDALAAAGAPDDLSRFAALQRYAATLDRTYERALRNMILLRAKPPLRNEPS